MAEQHEMFRRQIGTTGQDRVLRGSAGVPTGAAFARSRVGPLEDAVRTLELERGLALSEALERDRAHLAEIAARRPDLADAFRVAAANMRPAIRTRRRCLRTHQTVATAVRIVVSLLEVDPSSACIGHASVLQREQSSLPARAK